MCRYDHLDFCGVRHVAGLGDISQKHFSVWRFVVLADDSVRRFIVRDLDSLMNQRERDAVDEWLASNRTFHVMRDHPEQQIEILAGMWGGWNRYNSVYRPVLRKIMNATTRLWKDEQTLRAVLWPEMLRRRDVLAHDSYTCQKFPHTKPFPSQRRNREFVGAKLLILNQTVPEPCPPPCRPPQHQDWLWC
ncbi:uncharacterized protein LOC119102633 isoform X2 [Pollicipes pollicipes]|uniref:uncharacterized protein LOC119102633 isoform X2 n=1 Tax=Pollicipes pollicipes TaxID=41117 RepID=UPI0018854D2B|nr:uncharacterized protein LOC119102633 isoform X2 [Pollicipes pollicipes]